MMPDVKQKGGFRPCFRYNKNWGCSISRAENAIFAFSLLTITVLVVFPLQDPDTFWHLANGRAMVQERRIINEEIFSYTMAGTKFVNHEWLSQIILYLAYRAGGPMGLTTLKVLIVWLVGFLLYRTARLSGADSPAASLLVLAVVYAGVQRYTERPELFSILFVSLMGYLFYGFRAGRVGFRYLLLAPVIIVLWDFLHGALYGLVFMTAFTAGETLKKVLYAGKRGADIRRLWVVFAASLLAWAINPYGLMSYDTFLRFLHDKGLMVSANIEFEPTEFGEFRLFWFLMALTALLMAVCAAMRKIDLTHLFILLPFAAIAVKHNRASAFFALIAVPVFAYCQSLLKPIMRPFLLKALSVILMISLSFSIALHKFFQPSNPLAFGFGIDGRRMPVGAVRFLKEADLKGNMFNPGEFGGYIAYETYPERRIFQYNLHTVFGDFTQITQGRAFLDRYHIEYAIFRENPWTALVFDRTKWMPVYRDSAATVVVRNKAAGTNE